MAGKLCVGWLRSVICTVAIIVAYYWPQAYTFPAVIIAGGLATLLWSWIKKEPVPQSTVRVLLFVSCTCALALWVGRL